MELVERYIGKYESIFCHSPHRVLGAYALWNIKSAKRVELITVM